MLLYTCNKDEHHQPSEFAVAGVAWERNDIPDVFYPSTELHQALKAKAKASVGHRAVAPQVQIPPVIIWAEAAVTHAMSQHLSTLLTLTATNQLTNPAADTGQAWQRHRQQKQWCMLNACTTNAS